LIPQEGGIQFYINTYFDFLGILKLPGFGLISHIIINERKKNEVFGSIAIVYAIVGIGLLGFLV
jgi:heme/copper-type cytochrome/quinol oxidase subunit 1